MFLSTPHFKYIIMENPFFISRQVYDENYFMDRYKSYVKYLASIKNSSSKPDNMNCLIEYLHNFEIREGYVLDDYMKYCSDKNKFCLYVRSYNEDSPSEIQIKQLEKTFDKEYSGNMYYAALANMARMSGIITPTPPVKFVRFEFMLHCIWDLFLLIMTDNLIGDNGSDNLLRFVDNVDDIKRISHLTKYEENCLMSALSDLAPTVRMFYNFAVVEALAYNSKDELLRIKNILLYKSTCSKIVKSDCLYDVIIGSPHTKQTITRS